VNYQIQQDQFEPQYSNEDGDPYYQEEENFYPEEEYTLYPQEGDISYSQAEVSSGQRS
jgi:hypothetical protein